MYQVWKQFPKPIDYLLNFYSFQKIANETIFVAKSLRDGNNSIQVTEVDISDKISSIKVSFNFKKGFSSKKTEALVQLVNGLEGNEQANGIAKVIIVQVWKTNL